MNKRLHSFFEKIKVKSPFYGFVSEDEQLASHTTFRIGGPAALYLKPEASCFVPFTRALLRAAREESIDVFILGGGANVLFSDGGFEGIVLDTGFLSGIFTDENFNAVYQELFKQERPSFNINNGSKNHVHILSGSNIDEAVTWAACNNREGFSDFSGLPGTAGGAVYMNARCYETQISDLLYEVTYMDEKFEVLTELINRSDYGYKKSPFQGSKKLILSAVFELPFIEKNNRIAQKTNERRLQREEKGHFRYPSAGSVFKNNRLHGRPAGKIIEELGLRGKSSGGAEIAPWHGNFIINKGGATAADVRGLIALIQDKARAELGIELEPEIIIMP